MTSAPVPLQKLTVRFCEPLLIGSIVLIWSYVVQSWTGISVFIVACLFLSLTLMYRLFWNARQHEKINTCDVTDNDCDVEQNLHIVETRQVIVEKNDVPLSESFSTDGSLWDNIIAEDFENNDSSSFDSDDFEWQYLSDSSAELQNISTIDENRSDDNDGALPQVFEFAAFQSDDES
jgi:hypothetical protein